MRFTSGGGGGESASDELCCALRARESGGERERQHAGGERVRLAGVLRAVRCFWLRQGTHRSASARSEAAVSGPKARSDATSARCSSGSRPRLAASPETCARDVSQPLPPFLPPFLLAVARALMHVSSSPRSRNRRGRKPRSRDTWLCRTPSAASDALSDEPAALPARAEPASEAATPLCTVRCGVCAAAAAAAGEAGGVMVAELTMSA